MKRALALVVAIVLVAGALLFRSNRDSDADPDARGGGRGDRNGGGALTIGCLPELMEICEALDDVTAVEVDHGEVAEQADAIDGWMTFAPWPEAEAFGEEGLFDGEPVPVAEDRLGLVLSEDYEAELRQDCQEPITACAARATSAGGDLGVGDPGTALGRILLTAAVTQVIGNTGFGADEITANSSLIEDVRRSARARSSSAQLGERLGLGPSAPFAVLVREHEARVVDTAQGTRRNLVFRPLDPSVSARVVLAPVDGDRREELAELARAEATVEAFAAAGWGPPTDGPTGLPAGDVLTILED